MANGGGDLDGRKDAGGDLVEQRLEQVVVRPVDEGHADGRPSQCAGGREAAEPAADDDDMRQESVGRVSSAINRRSTSPVRPTAPP